MQQSDVTYPQTQIPIPVVSGLSDQLLDNKSRIFIKNEMRPYLGITGDENQGPVFCYIGRDIDIKFPVLTIINHQFHQAIGIQLEDLIMNNYDRVTSEEMGKIYRKLSIYRKVEIKSDRIQLNKKEKDLLNLSDDDRRIIIVGAGKLYHVWPYTVFEKHHPEIAQTFEMNS